jgi:hypothetical protein
MPTTKIREPASFGFDVMWVFLPAAACFFVINITNSTVLQLLENHHLLYGADASRLMNEEKTVRFFLDPIKTLLFFLGTAMLAARPGYSLARRLWKTVHPRQAGQTLMAMVTGFVLMATLFPINYGRSYARVSTDPFNQVVDQLYRRMLMPGLAYVYHINGFFYVFLCWTVVFFTILAAKSLMASRGHQVTLLEEISLLTVGIFASSFLVPGYPEIAVLLLGILALMDMDERGEFSPMQLAAFALALMAHESCAVIMFAPMILFFGGKRSWLPCSAMLGLYAVALLSNFSFDPSYPLRLQGSVSEGPASMFFFKFPGLVFLGIGFAFKLLWVLVPIGIYYQFKKDTNGGLFLVSGFALAIASTYIGVDYTRLVGFASIAMLLCFVEARKHLPARIFKAIVVLNLIVPTLYVGGNCGVIATRGLYAALVQKVLRYPVQRF